MKREVLTDGTVIYSGEGGSVVIQRLADGVLLLSALGNFETPTGEGPMREFDDEIAKHGSLVLFLNLMDRKGVAGSSREGWSEWAKRHRARLRAHVLVRSKLVDMAISVMAMMAGGLPLKSYSDVRAFEDAIRREAPGARGLPPLPARAKAAIETGT